MKIGRRGLVMAGSAALAIPAILPARAQVKTIIFGGSVPLSGGAAETGLNVNNGYLTAVKYLNEVLGGVEIAGQKYKLDLKLFDGASDPSRSVTLIQRQVDEGIDFYLGSFGSPIVLPAAAITERAEKPMVQAGGGSDQIFTQGYRYVFGMFPRATRQFISAATFIKALTPPVRNYALVFTNDSFDKTAGEGVLRSMKEANIPLVESYALPETISDASSVLTSVRAKAPDALIVWAHDEDAMLLTKQMIATDTNVNYLYLGFGPQLGSFRATLGKYANGIFTQQYWDERAPLKDKFFGSAKAFAEYYRKNFTRPIAYHVSAGAACITTFIEAMQRASSLEPAKVRDALAATDIDTQYGHIRFTPDGDGDPVLLGPWMAQVQKGEVEVLAPESARTAPTVYPTPPWSQRT
jgi:branched-chain amino acid transport system substrate-binding protein